MPAARKPPSVLPPALVRATAHPHEYAAFVAGLGVVRFARAVELPGGWVRLDGCEPSSPPTFGLRAFPRGVEVRVEDVRWVAEGP